MEGGSNVHGDESGGTSPSRQGAGTGVLVPRSLLAMAAEIGIASGEKGSILEGFGTKGKYRRRGQPRGHQGVQATPWRGLGGGRAPWPPGQQVGPPRSSFRLREASVALIFYLIFPDFFWQF